MWYKEKNSYNYYYNPCEDNKCVGINIKTGASIHANFWVLCPHLEDTSLKQEDIHKILVKTQLQEFNAKIDTSCKAMLWAGTFFEPFTSATRGNYLYFYNIKAERWCKLYLNMCVVEELALHNDFVDNLEKTTLTYKEVKQLLNRRKHSIIKERIERFNKLFQ